MAIAQYSKCVVQPLCVVDNDNCKGTGDHVMKETACCSTTSTCVDWGADWGVCRAPGQETCSLEGEQCFGTGASTMPLKACCDTTKTCNAINQYYSVCGAPPPKLQGTPAKPSTSVGTCPGLEQCPTAESEAEVEAIKQMAKFHAEVA